MQFIRGVHNLSRYPELRQGCVLTIGNFDGVHVGHQQILARLNAQAKQRSLPSVVLIFEPQPREFFARLSEGKLPPARLMRLRDKLPALQQMGVDYVLCVRFNQAFSTQTATAFIHSLLVEKLNVRYLSVGDDFHFGAKRSGNFETLVQAGAQFGFTVENSHSHCLAGERISSSFIRQALARGELSLAAQLLGRAYAIRGRVTHGNKLGRTLGFPTANLLLHRQVSPLQGVYAVQVDTPNGRFNGIANVGNRPTINGTKALLEVHLFDFNGDLYGKTIDVVFQYKVRDEIKFPGVDALQAQIAQDVAAVYAYFQQNTPSQPE